MSGPVGSQQWMYSSGFYPHEIGNSVRFDTNSYLARTPSSAGNRKTFTWSGWVKRGAVDAVSVLYGVPTNSGVHDRIEFLSDGRLRILYDDSNTGTAGGSATVAKFRDSASWYHFVIAIDTTQASEADRSKYYVNGVLQDTTSSNSGISQNHEWQINNSTAQRIASWSAGGSSNYFNGYMAEVNFIDGQALDPSYFGETKADTWIPKKYTGSYGTNGYYLNFATRATDPIDASGQGNNWTDTNVVATDWMLDSPTNNWATFNPVFGIGRQDQLTYSEGNLQVVSGATGGNDTTSVSTISPSGKVYAEFVVKSDADGAYIGAMTPDVNLGNGGVDTSNTAGVFIVRGDNGHKAANDGGSAFFGSAFSNGDIIQVAVDTDSQKLWFGRNGTWGSAGNPSTGANAALGASDGVTSDLLFICGDNYSSKTPTIVANFGQDSSFAGNKTAQGNTDANGRGDFYYAPPAGYLALCTANLPDPPAAINPAVNNSPQDYFNTVLWTGNGSDPRSITGVGFQPDFVWAKARNEPYSSVLYDVVRGTGTNKALMSNTRDAEGTYPQYHHISSLDSDGFTIGATSATNVLNNNNVTEVAWNWKAGGSGVSNSDGTITSTVSANTDAGFSIVTYTGNGSASATVGHGLGVTPAMVIVKCRSDGADEGEWTTAHKGISGQVMFLNQTLQAYNPAVFSTGGVALGNSSAFSFINGTASVDNSNKSGNTYVAYCFAEVEGFSKFGSYVGNSSEDGPFINTGFRPAFVMWKPIAGSENWEIIDSTRDPYNESYHFLRPNLSNAEASGTVDGIDMLSNGFKLKVAGGDWINKTGNTFIYTAFAEMPFKYANAR